MVYVKEKVPVKEGLFKWQDEEAKLIVAKCTKCGEMVFPQQSFCPECCLETMEPVTINSIGKLKCFTRITAPPPGYKGSVPYTAGIVEFPEGIRILGITTEKEVVNLEPGMEMEVIVDTAFIEDEKEYVMFKYKPVSQGED
ncbi:Zn-ribbon domain-containing OB-fold protein [Alteribacillus sp. YIM 98480]|uniref:Zn-ribbon domain-containing OB-fold protein n=1 Tax=Alteribacillus sp. YIM 98480 TaxID=2606599 RepID=UPI00131C5E46|nr:OB-fold domain-containing protein [Alteribacillus sp. YIM 98480]